MFGYQLLLSDDSTRFLVNVCSAKVNENIDDEEDFNNAISNDQLLSMIMRLESYVERHHDSYVADEYENNPIPN